jgi:hypothetical protein
LTFGQLSLGKTKDVEVAKLVVLAGFLTKIHFSESEGDTKNSNIFIIFIKGLIGGRDIYGRKPKSCLGRVVSLKLGSLTDNTINHLNASGNF